VTRHLLAGRTRSSSRRRCEIPHFDWTRTDKVRAAANLVFNGGKMSAADAREAINLLQKESEEHIRDRVGANFYKKYFPTNRHGCVWNQGAPIGWVDHYTAGIGSKGTLMWFSSRDRGPGVRNSCAHFVMDHDGTSMILVDPLTTVTWHATWANPRYIGVEHVNAGLLTKNEDGRLLYQDKHLYPVKANKPVQEIGGKFWEPYTTAQIAANIMLKRLIYLALPTLKEDKFVDHEIIDPKRKTDCGPLWPLKALNELVFSWENAHRVGVLDEEAVLTKDGVDRFNAEVQALTTSTTSHVS